MSVSIDLSAVRDGTGLTYRPATPDDIDAVFDLVTTCDQHDVGEALLDSDDIVGDWQRPSFDLATESVAVFDGDRLVAYAELYQGRRAEGCVHPDARGRGIGAALLRWTWDLSRARGGTFVGQPVFDGSDAVPLFTSYGYEPRWTSWILQLPPEAELTGGQLPPGTAIHELRPGMDELAAYEVIENAFSEWADRAPVTFEDWASGSLQRTGFEPWHLQLAVETGGDAEPVVVGAVHVVPSGDDAWIPAVAVRRDRRGLGLGRALLVRAFDAARAHGLAGCGLSTDSRTGALGLYEHVGMKVEQTFVQYAREV